MEMAKTHAKKIAKGAAKNNANVKSKQHAACIHRYAESNLYAFRARCNARFRTMTVK